ncbi:MAG: FMN-binding negative transcriptional regulator [Massilia sp.]
MYVPSRFEETRPDVMHRLVSEHPLGALVMHGAAGLDADHIPFEMSEPTPEAPLGVLRAHVARANPLWRQDGAAALVLFQGPSAYITPAFYEQKALDGKVVPTWDYAVVHARGTLRAVDDPDWLLALMGRLTSRHESPRPAPWSVDDAPRDYIERLLKAVVGIEIVIERLEGKWKASQDHSQGDRERIAAGLAEHPHSAPMAALMRATRD